MKVCCLFSLESPHRGDSYKYTQHILINVKKQISLNYPKYDVCSYKMFFMGLKNEFEIAVVKKPSVFEPLKFYSIKITPSYIHVQGHTNITTMSAGLNDMVHGLVVPAVR